MKYTRYNVKPKKKQGSNLIFYLALILLLALVLGTFIQKFLLQGGNSIWFKNQSQQEQGQPTDPSGENGDSNPVGDGNQGGTPVGDDEKPQDNSGEVVGDKYNFYLLQCGVFKVQENATKLLNTIKPYGNPFTETEGEVTKVYFGIYTDETIESASEQLKAKSIENSKVTVSVPVKDLSTGQLCKIVDNLLQIMNKTNESGVKSINTAEIKTWIGQLEAVDSSMKDYESVEEMKTYINNLPDEVDKNSFDDGLKLIYSKLIGFKL